MRPVVFSDCFGWLHDASGDCGVVICGALGFEQLCAHTGLCRFAEILAERGFPVLRFDYHGTGDSAGDDRDPDRLATWRSNVGEAIATLRAQTGVRRIYLAGLRFGALMALDHVTRHGGVDGLLLIAPVTSGRNYLRETAAFATLAGAQCTAADGAFETIGFRLSSETVASIKTLSPDVRETALPPRIFIASDPSRGAPPALMAAKAQVDEAPLHGLDNWLSEPTLSRPPVAMFNRMADWLGTSSAREAASGPTPALPRSADPTLSFDGLVEEPLRFGTAGGLFGMLCSAADRVSRRATIILNGGANSHVGWARSGVEMSRALARRGIPVLRMDVAGIGDSPAVAGRPEVVPYSPENVDDVRAAMDCLQARGFEEFTLVGMCSGGNLAIHAARADERVTAIVPVNVLSFVWRADMDLREAMRLTGRSTLAYGQRALDAASWRRLLNGDVDTARIIRALRTRALKVAGARLSALNPQSTTRLVRSWLEGFGRRGTRVMFVFSDGDQSIDEFRTHVGERRLFRIRHTSKLVLPHTDHNLTPAAARATLIDAMAALEHENVKLEQTVLG